MLCACWAIPSTHELQVSSNNFYICIRIKKKSLLYDQYIHLRRGPLSRQRHCLKDALVKYMCCFDFIVGNDKHNYTCETPSVESCLSRTKLFYSTCSHKVSRGNNMIVGTCMRIITFAECSSSVTHTTNRLLNSIIQIMSKLKDDQLSNSVYHYGH